MEVVVRPRVVSPHTGEALFLDDALEPFWTAKRVGPLCIRGRGGAGKSTALAWLARHLPAGNMTALLDHPRLEDVAELADTMLVVYGAEVPFLFSHVETFTLAPWGEDEILEYVLAAAQERAGSVIERVRAVPSEERPAWPEMWRACLDVMIEDSGVLTPRHALRRALDRTIPATARARARKECLRDALEKATRRGVTGLLRYGAVRRILAVEQLVEDLAEGLRLELPAPPDREFVREAGRACAEVPAAVQRLDFFADGGASASMAASLLVAAGGGWRPKGAGGWRLGGAFLAGAAWDDLNLHEAKLNGADFARAGLRNATFDGARMLRSSFREADMSGASLGSVLCCGADFAGARLDGAAGYRADFAEANFRGASVREAKLQAANFARARLEGAGFVGADLRNASFLDVTAGDVDFRGANLTGADFEGVDLRSAKLGGSTLVRAKLYQANLEGVSIHEADLTEAWMVRAHLTGSVMPRACLRGARLAGAALADVRWEGVDLRNADLRGCSFHLGTSRSGLVFGEPMQGSRTGFYDDPMRERLWRPAEEVRVADLRGADLRGALLDKTDFYRVDLRGAKLDPDQVEPLRTSGAILED